MGGGGDDSINEVGVNHAVTTSNPPRYVLINDAGIVSAVLASILDQP